MKRIIVVLAAGLIGVTVSGCGGGAAGSPADMDAAHAALPTGMAEPDAKTAGLGTDGAPVISVDATDTTCAPDMATAAAGKTWFKITNKGTKITELYLEKADKTEMIQVEKIRPGESGAFSTTLTAGSFLVACEPGMAGHDTQVRSPITVK